MCKYAQNFSNPVVVRICNVQTTRGIHCQALRRGKRSAYCRAAITGKRRSTITRNGSDRTSRQLSNAIISGVCDEEIAARVQSNTRRTAERSGRCRAAVTGKCRDAVSFDCRDGPTEDSADPVIVQIGNIDTTVRIYGDAPGVEE